MTRRVLLWCAYLLPLGYLGLLLAVTVHEVLGHGLTAVLYGGRFEAFYVTFDGMGAAWSSAPGHRIEVLAGGTIAQIALGTLLLAASALLRRRLLLRAGLLVLAFNLFLDGLPYGFWDAVYLGGRGDVSRILAHDAWAGHRALFLLVLGGLYVGSVALTCRMLFRTLEDDLGALSLGAASTLALAMVVGVGAGSAAFDWNQLVPGADLVPTWGSIGLQVVVGLWLVVTRRREVVPQPVPGRHWKIAISASWILCAAAVFAVAVWLRHGVRW